MINHSSSALNLPKDEVYRNRDPWGGLLRKLTSLFIILFPWMIFPFSTEPLESLREKVLFVSIFFLTILWLLRSLEQKKFEWRKTKINLFLIFSLAGLFLLFLYAPDLKFAWNGYSGSETAGFSEHLAFILFFFLAVQIFDVSAWEKNIRLFLASGLLTLLASLAAAVYFQDNNLLTLNFAKTPTIFTALCGVTAFSFWWLKKKSEPIVKGRLFLISLLLLFIASLLDFYLAWWMWFAGIFTLLLLDLIVKIEQYLRDKDAGYLNLKGSGRADFLSELFRGDFKYLSLILLFTFSRAVSPVFLGQKELVLMPFLSYLERFPLFGQRVYFYLTLNVLVFLFGLYNFFKAKKDRQPIGIVLSGLVCVSVGHLLYFSESSLLFFLNWLLIVFGGLTFLRKSPEKDFMYLLEAGSGKKVFVSIIATISLILTAMVYLKLLT